MKPTGSFQDQQADWVERTALTASFACLVHCLGLPILFAALPVLSRALPIPTAFHVWMVVIVVPMSSIALLTGRARHRATLPLAIGFVGLVLLVAGALFGGTRIEAPITTAGSLALAWVHIANWRLRHAHRQLTSPCAPVPHGSRGR